MRRFSGTLYRALNPWEARAPLSGRGAGVHGGRFNPRGLEAIYASLSPVTAIREAGQAGTLQPMVLLAYRAETGPIFDGRDAVALTDYVMTPAALADPGWREAMALGAMSPTQQFALHLIEDGFAGLLVESFAPGAGAGDLNLVLWRRNDGEAIRLEPVTDAAGPDR